MRLPERADGMITAYELRRINDSGQGSVVFKFGSMDGAVRGKSAARSPLFTYVSPGGTRYIMWSALYPAWPAWNVEYGVWSLALPGTSMSRDDQEVVIPAEHWNNVCNMIAAYNTKLLPKHAVEAGPLAGRDCGTCGHYMGMNCMRPEYVATGMATCTERRVNWIPKETADVAMLNDEPFKRVSMTAEVLPRVPCDERSLTDVLK